MSNQKKYDFILFGGDRLTEKGPLSELSIFLKKKKFSYICIIDEIHSEKKIDKKNNLKKYLYQKNINYIIEKKISEKKLNKLIKNNTLGLSLNSIWKFSPKIIQLFKGKLYNYHAADLPTERGGANITWRILLNKKKNISINIHKIEENYDTGEIVKSAKILLTNKEKLPYQHLNKIRYTERKFLREFIIDHSLKKKFKKNKQKSNDSFYWPTLKAEVDGLINWNWNAKDIVDFVKAFSKPYNGAFCFLQKRKVKILNAEFYKSKIRFHPFQSGIIFKYYNDYFYVACKSYYIKIFKKDIIGLEKNPFYYLGKKFSDS